MDDGVVEQAPHERLGVERRYAGCKCRVRVQDGLEVGMVRRPADAQRRFRRGYTLRGDVSQAYGERGAVVV